jgi:hypothetical protein
VFINTVDANTGYTADVAMGSFICQCANAGYTADAAMHSYICQTQDCSYSSTHFYQHNHGDTRQRVWSCFDQEVMFKGCENEARNSFADVAPPDC